MLYSSSFLKRSSLLTDFVELNNCLVPSRSILNVASLLLAESSSTVRSATSFRRSTLESKVLYTVIPGIQTRVEYRRDEDDQYRISGDEKTLISELPTRQFVYAVDFRREILEHVRLDLNFSQTFKDGPRVSELEQSFYNIRAQMVYEPFKKGEKKKKKKKGNNP